MCGLDQLLEKESLLSPSLGLQTGSRQHKTGNSKLNDSVFWDVNVLGIGNLYDRARGGMESRNLTGGSWARGDKMIVGDEINGGGSWV